MHDSLAVLNERLRQEGWRPLSNPVDLLEETELFVPANPGIYAFVLSGEKLPYPNSESSVAYIGETGNLSERIAVHRYHARTCKANKNGSIYFPRYEWVAARGGACLYSPAPESAANTKTTKEMETKLLQAFESLHYTIPVANMQRGKGCYAPATETVTTTV